MGTARIKKKSGVTCDWGTSSLQAQTNWGIVTAGSRKKTSELEEVPDESGYAVGLVYFNEKEELQVDVICKSSMSEPAVGDSITFSSGVTGFIKDVDLKWDNKSTKKMTVTATKYAETMV